MENETITLINKQLEEIKNDETMLRFIKDFIVSLKSNWNDSQ